MNKLLIAAAISLLSCSAFAAEVDPRELLDSAHNVNDCKAYAELVKQAADSGDFSFDGKPAYRRAMQNCKEVVAARETQLRTAAK